MIGSKWFLNSSCLGFQLILTWDWNAHTGLAYEIHAELHHYHHHRPPLFALVQPKKYVCCTASRPSYLEIWIPNSILKSKKWCRNFWIPTFEQNSRFRDQACSLTNWSLENFYRWLRDFFISSWPQNLENTHQKCENMVQNTRKLP